MTIELVCASANPDKVAEIAEVLASAGVALAPRPAGLADVVEDGDTLEANARLKAAAVAAAAGRAAVADDTGLEVDALGGRPGVHTGRFAAAEVAAGAGPQALYEANVAKLLRLLAEAGVTTPEAAPGPLPHGGARVLARRSGAGGRRRGRGHHRRPAPR